MRKHEEMANQAVFLIRRHGAMDTRSLAEKLGERDTKELSKALQWVRGLFFRNKKWDLLDR